MSYELRAKDHLVPVLDAVDAVPSYLIVGGLVFVPLSRSAGATPSVFGVGICDDWCVWIAAGRRR